MNKQDRVRHGDVGLVKIDEIPKDAKKSKHKVVLEGEFSGHSHRFIGDCEVLDVPSGQKYVVVKERSFLVHVQGNMLTKEHETIEVLPGKYKVNRQRMYDPYQKAIEAMRD